MIEQLFWVGYIGAFVSLLFASLNARKIFKYEEGNETMIRIAQMIRFGAKAFMKRQYGSVAIFLTIIFFVLAALAYIPTLIGYDAGYLNPFMPFAFITGGFFTALCGFVGVMVSTSANARTAYAATESLNKALSVSVASGSVIGFIVNGLALLEITTWYLILKHAFKADDIVIAHTMVTFGMGVAVAAIFARVGGGIFAKAANAGILAGKAEAGLPEDNPCHPAVIADNASDNVGNVTGMGNALHESIFNSLAAIIVISFGAGYGTAGFMLPIIISVTGILCSILGTYFVRAKEKADQKTLLYSLRRGVYIAGSGAAVAALPIVWFIANSTEAGPMRDNVWGLYGAVLVGIGAGFIVSLFADGMKSAFGPIITIFGAAIISFIISGGLRFSFGELTDPAYSMGLYGIGLAAVSMLSVNAVILATGVFGPVANNACSIAEMAHLPAEVRERTDALDLLGNTTTAAGKGFAIAANAFTGLALLVSYINIAQHQAYQTGRGAFSLAIVNPRAIIGFFTGATVVFLFAALCISAVKRAALNIVDEVRRQFKEIKGLMEGTEEADYAACVGICTLDALRETVAPVMLIISGPVITGILLGILGVIGYLAGIILTGFAMTVFMVISDTVYDQRKDRAGLSFNNVITVSCTVAIVFIGVTIAFGLLG